MSHQRHTHHVVAPITGTIWKITTTVGSRVGEEETVIIMESMKMEMPVESGRAGEVVEILVKEGDAVNEGQPLVHLRPHG